MECSCLSAFEHKKWNENFEELKSFMENEKRRPLRFAKTFSESCFSKWEAIQIRRFDELFKNIESGPQFPCENFKKWSQWVLEGEFKDLYAQVANRF